MFDVLLTATRPLHCSSPHSIIFVLTCSLLLFIFIPKILYFYESKENPRSTMDAIRSSLRMSNRNSRVFHSSPKDLGDTLIASISEKQVSAGSGKHLLDHTLESAKLGEQLEMKFGRLEKYIANDILQKLECHSDGEAEDYNDESQALLVVDSPELKEVLVEEHDLMKRALYRVQRQLSLWRISLSSNGDRVEQAPMMNVVETSPAMAESMSDFVESQVAEEVYDV